MKNLSTIAERLADEIRTQDWSDAHSRADGARHDRALDRKGGEQLTQDESELVRMNVIWVVGQALAEDDPNFSVRTFAEAAGATDKWLYNKDGRPNRGIEAGLRSTAR
jgi:hypothetical protein